MHVYLPAETKKKETNWSGQWYNKRCIKYEITVTVIFSKFGKTITFSIVNYKFPMQGKLLITLAPKPCGDKISQTVGLAGLWCYRFNTERHKSNQYRAFVIVFFLNDEQTLI